MNSTLRSIQLDRHPDILHDVRMPSSDASATRGTKPDLSSWPTHTEAAQRLGTNERTIHRWITSGRLRRAYRPAIGRKPIVIVDPADVERLRKERQQVVVVETAPMQTIPENPGLISPGIARRAENADLARQSPGLIGPGGDPFAGLAAHLARLAAAFPTPQPKPWLGLAEASEYSGLPRAWLIAQARAGALRAVNVAANGTRERWRFNREALIK